MIAFCPSYERAISGGLIAMVQVDGRYADKTFKDTNNTGYLAADSYWLWNAQASIAAADGRWEVAFWGKNLDDEQYLVQAANNGIGMGWRMYNMPRTYGATLSYRLGD